VAITDRTAARPLFRKLAFVMAFSCFLLGLVFGIVSTENRLMVVGVCLFVGFVMLTIARTGFWPPRRSS
jgi:hypothetical protein